MAASSAVRRSISLGLCSGTSRARGWRWPTGAPLVDRVSDINKKRAVAVVEDPAGDLAVPTVCAMASRLQSNASTATVLMKFRMITSPDAGASMFAGATGVWSEVLTLRR